MFNVHKTLIAASALAIVAAASCSDNKSRTEQATRLLESARTLVADRNYDSALSVLDTLDISYRDCLDQRRQGTSLRLTALAAVCRDSLASAEQQTMAINAELDQLRPQFRKIDVPGTDGYFVYSKTYTGSETNTTGIQCRVDDQGYLFVVASVAGKAIGLNSLSYNGVSTQHGNSVKVEGSEIMSLTQEQTAEFVDALKQASAPATVTLDGSRGKASVKLNAAQLQSVAVTARYASALQRSRSLAISLEKLERQIAKLNDNLANQIPVDSVAQ